MKLWQQDWITRWALYSPDKCAIKEHETSLEISYKSLNCKANGIAQSLISTFNVQKGDRVAVLAEYSIDYIALFSAAQKLGFAIVPMNYRLALPEISEIIEDSTPRLILVESKYANLVHEKFYPIKVDIDWLNKIDDADESPSSEIDEDDSLFIIYTSGTTGKPKGVKYTHKMAFWNSINTSISLKLTSESRTINVMPPFHTGGWNVLLLPFLHHGAFTYLCKKFEPDQVLMQLALQNCNIFMGVPTMLAMMAHQPEFQNTDLSNLDYIIVGGESMPIPLIETYAKKNVAIRQGYGMTEVGPNLTSLHQDDAIRKKGSIGRPNFYVRHRIINEQGQDCKANEEGELWLSGPMVTPGYWNNVLATKDAYSEDGQWFKTGDIVIEDEDKYIYIVDRLKNMYISGGENVYPAEIERTLRKSTAITDCAVIGVKDEKWGEVGKAFIVLQHLISEEEIKQFCKQNLAKFKVPKYFSFIDELPKTASGKIDRKALKLL
ncbi:MAG: AMP-binding protein [Saprospiraceae bacterium]